MNNPCSVELLESALTGELPPDREEFLHHHLAECEACSAALEQLAGGEAWRQELATTLNGDSLDDALSECPHAGGDEWSNVDFTVEHLEPADEPGVLGRLGGYDVLEIIGRGGMGIVLKAFDRELKRCVAIKVLSPHLAQSSLAKKRFAREAQAAAAVVHANVLAIHQVQPAARLPFLVMPLVAGESLAQRLTAQGRLELKEILRIGMQAAAGLSAAHEQGLVHRDVKPANILLEKGVERAVLTDFGLARAADDVSMTRWGIIAGTPQYMSPEQAKGEPVDGRSDLFSLGCVLYEMAAGVSPFRTESTLATLRRLIDDPPPALAAHDPELPPWFVGIVERLLEKDPAGRFNSAKEVSQLLEGCLAHLQQPASVPLPSGLETHTNPKRQQGSAVNPERQQGSLARASGWYSRPRLLTGTLAMLTLIGISLFAVGVMSPPPDIAGNWQGEDWGQVSLVQTAPGEYAGTYTDTVIKDKGPGKIDLKWSRIERRFNGTWREGEERFGDLSIRVVDTEIRGALTTDPKSKVNPATPRLADLTWKRAGATAAGAAIPESVLPYALVDPKAEGGNRSLDTYAAALSKLEWTVPLGGPPTAIAPFDAATAKEHQTAWARFLGVPAIETNSIGMRLALIPPGEFQMGASPELIAEHPKANPGASWDFWGGGPSHRVRITRPLYLGVYDVTQEDYRRVMGANPSAVSATGTNQDKVAGQDTSRLPVESVSWHEAVEFCRRLSQTPAEKAARRVYRLPTEAQWEYACRAGSSGRYYFSPAKGVVSKADEEAALGSYAWFGDNSGGMPHPVGEKRANVWGLFDMHGNVWQWCADFYNREYYWNSPTDDPSGPAGGAWRIRRGGSFAHGAWWSRSAPHCAQGPEARLDCLGFRVSAIIVKNFAATAPHAGAVQLDPMNYGQEGTVVGPAPPHAHAMQFDGEHYATVSPPPKFTAGDFTISLWFEQSARANNWQFLFMRGLSYRDQQGDIALKFNRNNGDLDFEVRTADSQWLFGWDVPQSLLHCPCQLNQWNHVVVTRRGDKFTMWMNGAHVRSERSTADVSDGDNTHPFIVGGIMTENGVEDKFQGALDDFRIFRRCLSDKEIDALHKSNGLKGFLQGEGRMKIGPLVALDADNPGIGATIPKGARLVALPLDSVKIVGGALQPGTHVDIEIDDRSAAGNGKHEKTGKTILQGIRVFAVNDAPSVETQDGPRLSIRTISLLVTPHQAETITAAAEAGTLRATVHKADDPSKASPPPTALQGKNHVSP